MAAPFQDCAVLFGDSITSQQYVNGSMQSRFCDAYRRTLDILNRGYGGYNTRWAKLLFPTIFAKKDTANVPAVRLVTIWFGANDAVLADAVQKVAQAVPLDEYKSNLRFFLESLTSTESEYAVAHTPGLNVVLVTPPPIYPAMMGPEDNLFRLERTVEASKAYADAVLELAAEYKTKESEGGGQGEGLREFLTDGVHLTSKGYGVLWDGYTKLVKNEFKGRGLDWEDLDDLPLRIPSWEVVDAKNPQRILDGMMLPPIRR